MIKQIISTVLSIGGFLMLLFINWEIALAVFVIIWGNNIRE